MSESSLRVENCAKRDKHFSSGREIGETVRQFLMKKSNISTPEESGWFDFFELKQIFELNLALTICSFRRERPFWQFHFG